MPPAKFGMPNPPLLAFNGNPVTDHNRGEFNSTPEHIEYKNRVWDGTMRKYFVAAKRTFSVSWDGVPKTAVWTVDHAWGGQDMYNFWKNNRGPFELTITGGGGAVETVTVMFSSFSHDIIKRGAVDTWNISLELEEV